METVEILEGQVNIFDEIDKLSKLTKEQLNTIEEIKQKDNVIEVKDPNHLGMCKALCEGYRENLIIPQGNREHAFYSCETKREYLIGADGNIISIKPLDLFSKPYVEEKKVVKNKKAKSKKFDTLNKETDKQIDKLLKETEDEINKIKDNKKKIDSCRR